MKTGTVGFRSSAFWGDDEKEGDNEQDKDEEGRALALDTEGVP
jgi:hypothetical protein